MTRCLLRLADANDVVFVDEVVGGLVVGELEAEAVQLLENCLLAGADVTEVAAEQNAYYKALEKYVAALRQTGASLDRLKESLERPVDLRAEAQRLLVVAFELRGATAEFRNPPAAAPTPNP